MNTYDPESDDDSDSSDNNFSIIPILSSKEVQVIQQPLGEGGFCSVSALRRINIDANNTTFQLKKNGHSNEKSTANTTKTTPTKQKFIISDEQKEVRKRFANQFHNYEKEHHSYHNIKIPNYNTPATNPSSILSDPKIQKPPKVALKKVKQTKNKRRYKIGIQDLAAEILVLSQCSHPNIITLYAVGYDDDDDDDITIENSDTIVKHYWDFNSDLDPSNTSSSSSSSPFFDPNKKKQQQISFAIIDQLKVTLRDRLYKWREDRNTFNITSNIPTFRFLNLGTANIFRGQSSALNGKRKPRNPLNDLWLERLVVLLKIADAIQYLHSKGIMHRDINPDNIGFSYYDNVVKLFDFGLAKCVRRNKYDKVEKKHVVSPMAPIVTDSKPLSEPLPVPRPLVSSAALPETSSTIPASDTNTKNKGKKKETQIGAQMGKGIDDKLFNLSKETGTLRYMAPEVAMGLPYGVKVDVYSFALVIYEILSLSKPYMRVSPNKFREEVLRDGLRPTVDESWPSVISNLLVRMWSSDVSARPNSKQVVSVLGDLLRGDDDELYPRKKN